MLPLEAYNFSMAGIEVQNATLLREKIFFLFF